MGLACAAGWRCSASPDDPADLVRLGIGAERAGLDGYFLWDHLVHSDSGEGPPIVDPWQVLAVVAARTSRIKLGTMITPVARRRPWKLAREVTTLDLLSDGRVIPGVGLGDPAHAEFGLFGEPVDRRAGGTPRRGAGRPGGTVDRAALLA